MSVPLGCDRGIVQQDFALHQQSVPEWRQVHQPQLHLLLRVCSGLLRLQLRGLLALHERAMLQQRDVHIAGELIQLQLSLFVLWPSVRGFQPVWRVSLSKWWSVHQHWASLPLSVSCRIHR